MRNEKQLLLDEVKEKIEGSKGFIIARYRDFTAGKARSFRDLVAQASGDFEIVRKRVFVKAAEAAGIKLTVADYKGHIGVIFANEDTTKVSKLAVKYSEENDKAIEVVGGHIDGIVCTGEEIEAIAKLPSLEELRAELLGLFEAPMAQTLAAINAVLTSVPCCLEEKAKKSQE